MELLCLLNIVRVNLDLGISKEVNSFEYMVLVIDGIDAHSNGCKGIIFIDL